MMNNSADKKNAHGEFDATEAPDTAQNIGAASPPPPIVGHMDTVEPDDSTAIEGLAGAIGMMDAIETLDYIPQDRPPRVIIGTMGIPQFVPPLKSEGVGRAVEEAIKYIWKGNPPSKWVFSELVV